MSTSQTTTSNLNAQDIVQTALEQMGMLSAGETATGEELATGIRHLNLLLKSFTARGINLWRQTTIPVVVLAGVASVVLDAAVEDVLDARAVSQTYDRQIFRYTRGQYVRLPNKQSPGLPTAFYADTQRDQVELYVWPVPQVDTLLMLDVQRRIQDVTEGTQDIDIPQKWLETVAYGLAARLTPVFGLNRLDVATAGMIAQRAQAFEQLLLDMDRPESFYLGSYEDAW